jgi:predicted ATP-binding protein involved in virulence
MRIDRLELHNFKKFAEQVLELHPQFTLLVGENGSGKTSVLDALAVALGVWLVDPPDSKLASSQRPIYPSEARLEAVRQGDRTLFQEAPGGVAVAATGRIEDRKDVTWVRQVNPGGRRTTNRDAEDAIAIIQDVLHRAQSQEKVLLPVIAYYGAGRAWLPHRERNKGKGGSNGPARRWAAFYDCLNERIRLTDLADWFRIEAIAAVNRGGQFRPGFEVVRRAVLACVPEADGMWYDGDREEIVLAIGGQAQPFSNLSAGQQMMLALVADIAIKAVTQNNYLVPPDALSQEDAPLPRVLAETPGVILIDEIDVHLHPRWQRRVAADLMATFPAMQFVCTSHSPQVIGELLPAQVRFLDEPAVGARPAHSFGLDANAVLEELMGADVRSPSVQRAIDAVEVALEDGDLAAARRRLDELKQLQHGSTRDTARLEARIDNLEALAHAAD